MVYIGEKGGWMKKDFFKIKERGSDLRTEILAGVTTFFTMAYIVIVNPAILEAAGIPKGPSMTATVFTAFIGTLIMGLYANRPFAIAPYMGENAFIAYTVVKVLGYPWQTALGAVFIGGVLFTLLTLFRLRAWLARSIPENLKYSFAVGIGLFLAFIGLNETGLVTIGIPGSPRKDGKHTRPQNITCEGSLLIGILFTAFLAYIFKLSPVPSRLVSPPPSLAPIFMKLDIPGALKWGFFSVILTLFIMDFVDTMGTLIGAGLRAGILDEKGNFPEIEKPMLADALATVFGAIMGTTTAGTYIESCTGIEEGGRTGLTSLVTAFLFLLTLFFSPLFTSIPPQAYGPALIIVGVLMMSVVNRINFHDLTEGVPAFAVAVLMPFTFNLGIGITAGFLLYCLLKLLTGRAREISGGCWILGILSLLFYIFYPYH